MRRFDSGRSEVEVNGVKKKKDNAETQRTLRSA